MPASGSAPRRLGDGVPRSACPGEVGGREQGTVEMSVRMGLLRHSCFIPFMDGCLLAFFGSFAICIHVYSIFAEARQSSD